MADRFSTVDWDDLRVFLAVHRAGTLRGAARSLGVNHATVTRRLTRIEGALAADLFTRRAEGLVPSQRSEEHTSELQSLMRISYAVFCLKKKKSEDQILTTITNSSCNNDNI